MNYMIFKNINSNMIKGLMISELSPISKPQMRTEITTIDGRDGDIVNNLGYASYDKTLKIGLTYDYDINEIIKYFSGEGNLILSNEVDKYYVASCNYQIDYERLLRFKTANVKFHVQPYKYKLNEKATELEITEETELIVINEGLENSKPIITLYGSGIINISINGISCFEINIDDEYVVIDSLQEEAYKDSILKNRNMNGKFPSLNSGENVITWTGNLTKIIVEPKSRWL